MRRFNVPGLCVPDKYLFFYKPWQSIREKPQEGVNDSMFVENLLYYETTL